MKINWEKLERNCGIDLLCDYANNRKDAQKDLLFYVKGVLYNLQHNNKNYTKKQYEEITLLNDIFECIEE